MDPASGLGEASVRVGESGHLGVGVARLRLVPEPLRPRDPVAYIASPRPGPLEEQLQGERVPLLGQPVTLDNLTPIGKRVPELDDPPAHNLRGFPVDLVQSDLGLLGHHRE